MIPDHELPDILNHLLSKECEDEVLEFKEAKNNIDFNDLGEYFSALCNEANLKGKDGAWLILGIRDKDHEIVGTSYKSNKGQLHDLKRAIAEKTSNAITFIDIYEVATANGRVVMFHIPPAPIGMPVNFGGHYYGRDGHSLVGLSIDEIEKIRHQERTIDWSAEIVKGATISDLDNESIRKARLEYVKRNPKYGAEIDDWDDRKFLDKSKITIGGKITRTALLLLAKEEALHFVSPGLAKIRWALKAKDNEDLGYEIFNGGFVSTVDRVYSKIRNLNYRYLQPGTLFVEEMLQYDPFTIRELLHNCIAHQDYSLGGIINVIEFENDRLVFSNLGGFIPLNIEAVVLKDTPEEFYRNRFLVEAMRNIGMIETQGGGIKKVFNNQRQRLFPLPDFDLEGGKVRVSIIGRIIDMNFGNIIIANPGISLQDIILLDKVQKGISISQENAKYLRVRKFIEGRRPNLFLSSSVVAPTDSAELKAQSIRNRSFDKEHFTKMIIGYLSSYSTATRKDFDALVLNKLPDLMTPQQKKRLSNYLSELRAQNIIQANAEKIWTLVKPEF